MSLKNQTKCPHCKGLLDQDDCADGEYEVEERVCDGCGVALGPDAVLLADDAGDSAGLMVTDVDGSSMGATDFCDKCAKKPLVEVLQMMSDRAVGRTPQTQ